MIITQAASGISDKTLGRKAVDAVRSGKSVLVVDDDPDLREFIYFTLSPLGYDVCQAASGEECLEILMQRRFDLLLLDLRMPGMEGMEVLERVRAWRPELSVILISAYADWPDYFLAVSKGARDVIPKPLTCSELLRVVWAAFSPGGSPPGGPSAGEPQGPEDRTDSVP